MGLKKGKEKKMFTPHKSDTGAVLPHEYVPAAAGVYEAGQMLAMSGGMCAALASASAATPAYLCMAEKKIDEAGGLLPVTRVSAGVIYETTLSAAAETAAPGVKLRVSAGGKQVSAGAGTFEVTALDGTAEGSSVRGRFV